MRQVNIVTLPTTELAKIFNTLVSRKERVPVRGKSTAKGQLARKLRRRLEAERLYVGTDGELHAMRRLFPDSWIIHLRVRENPKRPGTQRYEWFAKLRDGMTVAQYVKRIGDQRAALRFLRKSAAKGYLVVTPE